MEQFGYLLAACFAPVNIVYTILLIIALIYWILVVVGAVGMDLFDFDLDLDSDADLDVDVNVDMDGDVEAEGGHVGGALRGLLMFFNLGEVPVMVFASFLFLSMWIISLTANVYLNNTSVLIGLAISVPNLLLSLFVAKFCTTPIKKVFKALDKPADIEPDDEVLGQVCVITTSEATPTFGQASIATDGRPLLLNVITRDEKVFKRGEEAIVIEYINTKDVYLVDTL